MPAYAVVVLMVEDHAIIRMQIADLIRDAGFEVIEAINADAALKELSRRGDVRILVTDVDMPGSMNGIELAHTVRGSVPAIGVIVMSGMAQPTVGELPDNAVFISKPIDNDLLVTTLRDLVA